MRSRVGSHVPLWYILDPWLFVHNFTFQRIGNTQHLIAGWGRVVHRAPLREAQVIIALAADQQTANLELDAACRVFKELNAGRCAEMASSAPAPALPAHYVTP